MLREKQIEHLKLSLQHTQNRAKASAQRWTIYGGLAWLVWLGYALQLPPVNQTDHIEAYCGMAFIGVSLLSSITKNVSKARQAQKEGERLQKKLARSYPDSTFQKTQQAIYEYQERYAQYA